MPEFESWFLPDLCTATISAVNSLCVVLQEYRSPLRLAIEFKLYPVVDAFLDRHPDVKPGLRGHLELDSKDKVSQHSFVQRKEHFPPNSYVYF